MPRAGEWRPWKRLPESEIGPVITGIAIGVLAISTLVGALLIDHRFNDHDRRGEAAAAPESDAGTTTTNTATTATTPAPSTAPAGSSNGSSVGSTSGSSSGSTGGSTFGTGAGRASSSGRSRTPASTAPAPAPPATSASAPAPTTTTTTTATAPPAQGPGLVGGLVNGLSGAVGTLLCVVGSLVNAC